MISILCPTRKRPDKLRRMLDSVKATALIAPQILCYVSNDDLSYDTADFSDVQFVRGPRLVMSDLWNVLIPHASGEIFMQCADDVVFRTPGWDRIVEQAFADCPDKILLTFGDDLGPNGKHFATLPFVHRRWVEIVGYFTGPGYSADFSDTHPNDVADMIGRKRFLPIVIEHLHWIWGKAEKDETYRETQDRLRRDNTPKLYQDRLPERIADAEKLRKVMRVG